jgi:hypothetical protein
VNVRLEEIPGEDLDLLPTETMLGTPLPELCGIVRIGDIVTLDAMQISAGDGEALDPELRVLAKSNRFVLARIPLSIRPGKDTSVRFLAVEISLEAMGGSAVSCWSMDPERVDHEVRVSTTFGLSTKLKPQLLELGAERSRSAEFIVRQPVIVAFGVGLADVAWEFSPRSGSRLQGVQLLHLVIKAPLHAACKGVVEIRADVVVRQVIRNLRAVRRDRSHKVAEFAIDGAG